MSKILDLRQKRSELWDKAKAFLDSASRSEDGTLSAEDLSTYEKMEADIDSLGREISAMERREQLDAKMSAPVTNPIVENPDNNGINNNAKTGRASDEYKNAFWQNVRMKSVPHSLMNSLNIGTDGEGGYLVPDEYEQTLVQALEDENFFRSIATTITTAGDRKIPMATGHGTASWAEEKTKLKESDETFAQETLGAYKATTTVKVSEELLYDSVFNLEAYISQEFARRIGSLEEEAFLVGDGTGKPTGVFNSAKTGVTAASAEAITFDEIFDLFYSLKSAYRKNGIWICNDTTIKALRKIKDANGQYLWQPSVSANTPDMLSNRPIKTSSYAPEIGTGKTPIIFGDFSYYWIADRQGRSFKKLAEIYSETDEVGFKTTERVDGKLLLPEAVQALKMA